MTNHLNIAHEGSNSNDFSEQHNLASGGFHFRGTCVLSKFGARPPARRSNLLVGALDDMVFARVFQAQTCEGEPH